MMRTMLLQLPIINRISRYFSTVRPIEDLRKFRAWQVHSFGDEIQCCSVRMPIITSPTEVIVKIDASSVNPIDTYMQNGYGRTIVNLFRRNRTILPIILGRDWSGVIVDKGQGVGNEFNVGDKVYGVIPFYNDGAHGEYVVVEKANILQQPDTVTHTEAASILYAALTAYSALWVTGGLSWKNPKGMKILILGASGGVGTAAVQMLKAVDATVIGTCSTNALPLVLQVGADFVLDYSDPEYEQNVASKGRYDIILDCAQVGYSKLPISWQYSTYITLNSPLLHNTDQYGLFSGLALSAFDIIPKTISSFWGGKCVKWAFFFPSADGLKFIDKLVRNHQLIPVIDKIYKFDEMPTAYNRIKEGHLRGKVVIDMLPEE